MSRLDSTPLRHCSRCPRLVALRTEVRDSHPDYHAAPVPAWGRQAARLLIVGLAPGMHGANRTGRPFSGDSSGDFLFRALHRAGFSSAPDAAGARLINCRITNAVKCLPPGNKPVAAEIHSCRPYLMDELTALRGIRPRQPRVVLCLGRIAHDAVARSLVEQTPGFRHGQLTELAPNFHLADIYHPSRLNTNTGRLTESMLDEVFERVRHLLAPDRCLDSGNAVS